MNEFCIDKHDLLGGGGGGVGAGAVCPFSRRAFFPKRYQIKLIDFSITCIIPSAFQVISSICLSDVDSYPSYGLCVARR